MGAMCIEVYHGFHVLITLRILFNGFNIDTDIWSCDAWA